MLKIAREQKNGFEKVILVSDSVSVEIVPACGAMLHAFIGKSGNETINIIDSYSDKTEFDNYAESEGFKGLKLSPFACRIQNSAYDFEGKQYTLTPQRQNDSAIHGLLYNKKFEVIAESEKEDSIRIVLLCKYAGDNEGYPFAYACEVEYSLSSDGSLSIKTSIKNDGDSPMPIADGWHPYFSFQKKVDELELQFNSTSMLEFVNFFPTGKTIEVNDFVKPALIGGREIDNSFILDFSSAQPMCILKDAVSGWQLEISPDGSYPYLQIYIPPHRNSIAIENLSAPPDAFNNKIGLILLNPGSSTSFTTKYYLHK